MFKKADYKRILKGVWIAYALFSIFIVLYLVDRLVCKEIDKVSKKIYLNDNWNITVNDELYENVSIDSIKIDSLKNDDKIILETTISKDIDYNQAALCVTVKHVTVSMYIDGELVYEYGKDRHDNNKTTGNGYIFINFYEEYKGKDLKLEYVVTEKEAFSRLNELWLCEWENVYREIATSNRLPLIMGSFLLVFGVMVSFVQIFAVAISAEYKNVLLLALFSICIGIWTLCYYDVMLLFAIPLYKISLIEHMTLFISPLPILGYMYSYIKEIRSKGTKYLYYGLFSVQFVLTTLAIVLHTMDLVHGPEMLKYFQVLFIVHVVFFIYVIYSKKKNNSSLSKISTAGLVLVVLCVFYELITYLTVRYTSFKILEIKGISSVGLTIFIGILVIDLYQRVTKNMMEEQEKALLIKKAYTDELTQLHNRTYCSEHMRQLSLVKKSNYTIINFDLNGLKQMNDTYGHTKGDELICYAALVLDKSFSDEGVVGRMGGDEFIAIIETDDTERIEKLLDKFRDNIKEVNNSKPDIGLSISYGYAVSTELEGASFEKIYNIADERMYEYKQAYKKKMAQSV